MAYDKSIKIYNAITDLPDELIEEAHTYVPEHKTENINQYKWRKHRLSRILSTAAAVLLIVGGVVAVISIATEKNRNNIINAHHAIGLISETCTEESVQDNTQESSTLEENQYIQEESGTEIGNNDDGDRKNVNEDTALDKPLLITRNFVTAEESLSGGGDMGNPIVINDFMSDQMAVSGGMPGLIRTDEEDWDTEPIFAELPVFTNGAYDPDNHMGYPYGLSEAEMNSLLKDAAARLYLNIGEPYVPDWVKNTNAPIYFVWGDADDGSHLEVRADGSIIYSPVWDHGGTLPIPEEYQLDTAGNGNPVEKVIATLEYLTDEYGEFISFDNPQIALNGTIDEDGIFRGDYYIYEASHDAKTNLINYALRTARFSMINGRLLSITLSDGLTGAEYVDDYPIKSASEAADDLLAGYYYSSFFNTFEITDRLQIGRAVLTYRTGPFDNYIIPYYLFYVDVSSQFDAQDYINIQDGEKAYALYYVPAVANEYVDMEESRTPIANP